MTECARCSPPVPHDEGRLCEGHIAVRFRDNGRGWTVLLDGEDVTDHCIEALAMDDIAWVVLTDHPAAICPHDREHIRVTQHHGHVQLIRR